MAAMQDDKRWFKPKDFGWGFTPASWRGWVATLVFVVLALSCAATLRVHYGPATTFQAIAVLIVGFLVLGSYTGAAGWWRKKRD